MTIDEVSRRASGGIISGVLSKGKLVLNPPRDLIVQEQDSLLILEENRGSCVLGKHRHSQVNLPAAKAEEKIQKPSRVLILSGQSRNFNFMLKLLDKYSNSGSEIVVAGSIPVEDGTKLLNQVSYRNCRKSYIRMERTNPEAVERLHLEQYDSIMVISGKSSVMSDEDADSECIITLLIIREISTGFGGSWSTTVVSEIRNPKNRRLASAAGIDDFVISNEVCSMIMAQLVIQPEMRLVYEELFNPPGCEIELRDASLYTQGDFAGVSAQGAQRGEVVLGWLEGFGSESKVSLNPPAWKKMPVEPGTRVVVIAER